MCRSCGASHFLRGMQSVALLAICVILSGCDDSDDPKGKSNNKSIPGFPLGIPELKPPVQDATPSGLKQGGGGRRLRELCLGTSQDNPDCKTEIQIIKDRMFPEPAGGPQDFTYRLGEVDLRMQGLSERNTEAPRMCVNESTKLWNPPMLPGRQFPMHFSCEEKMNAGAMRVFFGLKDSFAYIAQIQESGFANLAKIKKDSSEVHVWQISLNSARTNVSLLEIKAARQVLPTNATVVHELEVSYASNEVGTSSIGCGVRLISKGGNIFVSGTFADRQCSTENKLKAQGGSVSSVCVDGSTLTNSSGSCSTLSPTLLPMNSAQCADYVQFAAAWVPTFGNLGSLGLTDFNVINNGTNNGTDAVSDGT